MQWNITFSQVGKLQCITVFLRNSYHKKRILLISCFISVLSFSKLISLGFRRPVWFYYLTNRYSLYYFSLKFKNGRFATQNYFFYIKKVRSNFAKSNAFFVSQSQNSFYAEVARDLRQRLHYFNISLLYAVSYSGNYR